MTGPETGETVLVSACLLGRPCRYDGGSRPDPGLPRLLEGLAVVEVCPEVMGGLAVPRPASEFRGGTGPEVCRGRARLVFADTGEDVTAAFLAGARETLRLARRHGVRRAFLKSRSPSCGRDRVSQGGRLIEGWGVAAWMLARQGVEVVPVEGEKPCPPASSC